MAIYKLLFEKRFTTLTLFQLPPTRLGRPKRLPFPKICLTYPAMTTLGTAIPYPKKIRKIHKSSNTLFKYCRHQHFFIENQKNLQYQEIQI